MVGNAVLDNSLAAIEAVLARLSVGLPALDRFRSDLSAARFHLRRPAEVPPLVAILGGTGTGKSTLLNRLLQTDVTSASFKRTFTAGPIAVVSTPSHIPPRWLQIEHETVPPDQLPSRGQFDRLAIAVADTEITRKVSLIDTPDLDGDQPVHHAQADRVFRWVDAIVFLVTPEKYQMTELLPYYRLARRYGLIVLHVMNKVEEQAVVDDYREQMEGTSTVFSIPRDDAAYEPPPGTGLHDLRNAIASISVQDHPDGNASRVIDLMERLRDQIIDPMRNSRQEIDRLIRSLRAMETPGAGVDVNPLMEQLQRRLQQRSVLYLMGPGRVLDRVRQVPGILARLPRTTWDLLRAGRLSGNGSEAPPPDVAGQAPGFGSALVDQFDILQTRIDDLLASNPASRNWIDTEYASTKIDPAQAGQIADDEIAKLKEWLEKQWNATPRDTAVIQKLLKVVPGGEKLTQWSEAAPYVLAVVVATHGVFFGHLDLLILGGYSLATWLSEKLSNQVAARARQANTAIATRFAELAHRQIDATCAWLDRQAPAAKEIQKIAEMADEVSESLQAVHRP